MYNFSSFPIFTRFSPLPVCNVCVCVCVFYYASTVARCQCQCVSVYWHCHFHLPHLPFALIATIPYHLPAHAEIVSTTFVNFSNSLLLCSFSFEHICARAHDRTHFIVYSPTISSRFYCAQTALFSLSLVCLLFFCDAIAETWFVPLPAVVFYVSIVWCAPHTPRYHVHFDVRQ